MTDDARQPLLHDLVTCVSSPTTVLSAPDGQIHVGGAQGVFVADVRVLSRAELVVDGSEPESVSHWSTAADTVEFLALVRSLGDVVPDPTVWVRRRRVATPGGFQEAVTLVNVTDHDIATDVEIRLSSDMAGIDAVKRGLSGSVVDFHVSAGGFRVAGPGFDFRSGSGAVATITAQDAEAAVSGAGGLLLWRIAVPPRSSASVRWSLRVTDGGAAVIAAESPAPFVSPRIDADDRRISPFVARSVEDLAALRMCTARNREWQFLAAGSPWYLTLFGRDALWAARMLLPLGTEIAEGTLRSLAAWQGVKVDPATGEEPGKMLHELRRSGATESALPPVYYGTVDATPLWVCLLADAWRWGLAGSVVEELIPTAERALEWLVAYGDSDGDGFLEYADRTGRGLANQGWKDSSDSVRFADGRIAAGPIALAEVQGYAHEAALAGAELLDAFGRPGAQRWRDYAGRLAEAFRATFWVNDGFGPYPAMALDGNKRPVDAVASNMGHLMASGMLTLGESSHIAERLVHPAMASGFGLRTMSAESGGYSPLSYHCGSVWPHDTAIAILGLNRAGFTAQAAMLAAGLLDAAAEFDHRLPELFGGFNRAEIPQPVPYPAACRPQAWSAAAAIAVVQGLLGLEVDVPKGRVRMQPAAGLGAISVDGIRAAGKNIRASVTRDGRCEVEVEGGGLTLVT